MFRHGRRQAVTTGPLGSFIVLFAKQGFRSLPLTSPPA